MFLLNTMRTACFCFQFRCMRYPLCNTCIIQMGLNIQEIYSFKRVFIEKLAYTISLTNIFRYFIFNGSDIVSPRYCICSSSFTFYFQYYYFQSLKQELLMVFHL